jgi:transcriptional regulator of met regulon
MQISFSIKKIICKQYLESYHARKPKKNKLKKERIEKMKNKNKNLELELGISL